jgi:ABC-type branched-subunit amino acid transport system substrate-binding protein
MIRLIAAAIAVTALAASFASAGTDGLQDNLRSQISLAEAAYHERQYSQAAELLSNITSLNPSFESRDYLLVLEAKARYFAGELGRSGSLFERLIAEKGRFRYAATCYYFLGRISFDRQDYLQAAADFANALSRTKDQKLRDICFRNCMRLLTEYLPSAEQSAFLTAAFRSDRSLFREISYEAVRRSFDSGAYASAEAIMRYRYALDSEIDSRMERMREEIDHKRSAILSIALLAPLTGEYEAYGSQMAAAAEIAVSNAGESAVKLDIYDTHGSAVDAAQIARKVASEGVSVLIGPLTSQEAVGAAAYSDLMSVPIVLPAASEEGLTAISRMLFQLAPTPATMIGSVADAARSMFRVDSAVILAPNDDYGLNMSREFRAAAAEQGITIVGETLYPRGCKDFRRFILSMKRQMGASNPTQGDTNSVNNQWIGEDAPSRVDAIFLPANADELRLIVPQLRFYGVSARLLGSDEMAGSSPADLMSANSYDALFPSIGVLEQSDTSWARFKHLFKQAEGLDPIPVAGLTYDAIQLAIKAGKAGGFSGDGIARGWKSLGRVGGVSGYYEFSEANENRSVSVYFVRDGELKRVRK